MKLKQSITSMILLVAAVGCTTAPDEISITEKTSVQAQYEKAQILLESGSYYPASEVLSELDSRYPFGPHSHQIQLDLMYTYYKMGKSAQSLAAIDRFIRLNPTHKNIDYVHYLRGLVNVQMTHNALQESVGIERYDRDTSQITEAFNDFKNLIVNFPNSEYTADAKQRMLHLKDYLSKSEIAAAEFYIKRNAFAAAASRATYILETFSDTKATERALEIMVLSYDELKLDKLKQNALSILKFNYPNNAMAKRQ